MEDRFLSCWVVLIGLAPAGVCAELSTPQAVIARPTAEAASAQPAYETRSLQGRVVWFAEALQQRYGITTVPEARQQMLALETSDGTLYPIIEDIRGRGVRKDLRLRAGPVEMLVRHYRGSPAVQIIRLYALRADGKYELDYWCDVCAIPMFELKPCECCQGPIQLRARRMAD